jgi:hypothetical protein
MAKVLFFGVIVTAVGARPFLTDSVLGRPRKIPVWIYATLEPFDLADQRLSFNDNDVRRAQV